MTPRAGGAARVYALLVAFACAAVVPVPVLGAASAIVPVHGGATEVLELHGSGTTNPSKLFLESHGHPRGAVEEAADDDVSRRRCVRARVPRADDPERLITFFSKADPSLVPRKK